MNKSEISSTKSELSVGLSSTVSSLIKDDEDFQIVHAQQLLTYLSNKGYYPPESIVNIILDLFKSKRSNDEAVVFQIMEILSVFKDNSYFIGLEDWDLLLTSLVSLRYHLTGVEIDGYPKEKRFQYLISKLLVSYFISTHTTVAKDIDSIRNRRSKLIDEIMNLMQYCDLETFKELLNFLLIIYETSQAPHIDILPLICTGFELINQFNRRVLFCQLLPPGKIKNQMITEFIEDIFPSDLRNKKNNGKALIEELSKWFIKLVKKNFKKQKSSGSPDNNDSLNDSVESTKSLYSMDLDLQEPIGIHELFVLLCAQLYQSAIITATENTATTDEIDDSKVIQWDKIHDDFKEFSEFVFNFIQDSSNVSNPDLIKTILNDLDIIFEFKSLNDR